MLRFLRLNAFLMIFLVLIGIGLLNVTVAHASEFTITNVELRPIDSDSCTVEFEVELLIESKTLPEQLHAKWTLAFSSGEYFTVFFSSHLYTPADLRRVGGNRYKTAPQQTKFSGIAECHGSFPMVIEMTDKLGNSTDFVAQVDWMISPQLNKQPVVAPMPAPLSTILPVDQQLRIAEEYFQKKQFLTPENKNAFEIYQDVLSQDPSNQEAREKIYAMKQVYKTWAENAYKQKNNTNAKMYYKRYVFMAEYLLYTIGEQGIWQELQEMQARLDSLGILLMPTPTPTLTPVPMSTPTPMPTPTPTVVFRITGVVVHDSMNRLLQPVDEVYSVRLGETITVTVQFTMPPDHRAGIVWTTGHGKVPPGQESTNTYTAVQSGGDYIVVSVWDRETGEELSQTINIYVEKE